MYHPKTHPRSIAMARVLISLIGSVTTASFIFLLTAAWIGWNTLGPSLYRFDSSPGFVILLLIVNVFSIILQPVMLVSNNLQETANQQRYEEVVKQLAEIKALLPKG